MNDQRRIHHSMLAVLCLPVLLFVGQVYAQTNTVEFRLENGGEGGSVATKDGEAINWDSNGNLLVVCADDDDDGYCDGTVGKSSGSGEGAASLNYFRFTGGSTSLTLGAADLLNVTLEWQGDANTDVCLSGLTATGAGASPTTWSDRLPKSGSKALTLAASTANDISYQFSMTCYNEAGSDIDSGSLTATATVLKRETPDLNDACTIAKGVGEGADPLFQPDGYVQHIIPWSTVFYYEGKPNATVEYPDMREAMYPVGSWTLGNLAGFSHTTSMKGRYISIPFTADTHTQNIRTMYWWAPIYRDEFPLYNPTNRQASQLYITISPCAGDFRLSTKGGNGSADGSELWSACRKLENQSSISYGKSYCTVQDGQTYYINLLYADPTDGLSPTETNCLSTTGVCEVMFE